MKGKPISNTVITSKGTWLKSGPSSTVVASRDTLLKKFIDILPKSVQSSIDQKSLQDSCGNLPLYVVPNSRPTSDKSDNKTNDGGKNKPGTPQYTGETTTSVEDVLSISDACLAGLTRLDESLQAQIATQKDIIGQDTTDLTTLSASLVDAQKSGSRLVEDDLKAKVAQKKTDLQKNQEESKSLSQADSYVATLISQVTATRKAAYTQAASGPPAQDASKTSVVADVFLTIQQNILKFLVFSLIVGQIFDPIQRGLVSFVGPRRDVFSAFNNVYGLWGDGEFRYGDRRVPPWTGEPGDMEFLPNLDLPDTPEQAAEEKKKEDREGLRYSPADFAYRRNMNIYDQNYAIGAGYITQSEFNGIYNEFFSQSQITSGLILPLLILSVCIGIRFICCATVSYDGRRSWLPILAVFGAIYFGFLLGLLVSYLISNISSVWKVFGFLKDRQPFFIYKMAFWYGVGLLLSVVFILAWHRGLRYGNLLIIAMPCVFLVPLWIAGLDRLHKFYSELQARIAGNFLRLQESTQQKMVDLINQSDSLASLQKNLRTDSENRSQLRAFVDQWVAYRAQQAVPQNQSPPEVPPAATPGDNPQTTPGDKT